MTSPTMPRIYKSSSRYSDEKRPSMGEKCLFLHGLCLIPGEFVSRGKEFVREWISQGALVRVLRNKDHLVEVMFPGALDSDLVSPDFLMKAELTAFGKAFFSQHFDEMSPQVRKLFIGE